MSPVDTDFPSEVREAMLEEIRNYLPAFLRKDATEQYDPVGDVKEILNLEEDDLRRVTSVHGCLDETVVEFGCSLREGMRHPLTASVRPAEVGQAVRGPVDWSATIARRSLEAGDRSRYVVRSSRKVFDIPENRALAWLLTRLRSLVNRARTGAIDPSLARPGAAAATWSQRVARLAAQIEEARRADWLQGVEPEVPSRGTMARLRASRSRFYREGVAGAAKVVMALENPSDELLAELLCRRYFEPAQNWLIFEVCVALRLAREFARASGRPRKSRLMLGSKGAPFARYELADGSEVSLILKTWPVSAGRSLLEELTERQSLTSGGTEPDLFIVRKGSAPDVVLLELKASYRPQYLREGLTKLLAYLAERPDCWRAKPSAWLVGPASPAFDDATADADCDIWMVSADRVAAAAVDRFAPPGGGMNPAPAPG